MLPLSPSSATVSTTFAINRASSPRAVAKLACDTSNMKSAVDKMVGVLFQNMTRKRTLLVMISPLMLADPGDEAKWVL